MSLVSAHSGCSSLQGLTADIWGLMSTLPSLLQASKLAEKLNAEAAAREAEAAEAEGIAGSPRATSSPGDGQSWILIMTLLVSHAF